MTPDPRSIQRPIQKISANQSTKTTDHLAVEEPLEIQLLLPDNPTPKPISITMRTPGRTPAEDLELALGFLFSEAIIHSPADIRRYYHAGPENQPLRLQNILRIELATTPDLARLDRHFYTTSSCGVCGKASIQALQSLSPKPLEDSLTITFNTLHALPEFLREQQSIFETTGGLHAAALFSPQGKLLALREDVGRHNALDKLIGAQFLANNLPLKNTILLLSGRASFELLQKAAMAQIPIVASVGAPSSLAAELAGQFNITLIGFLRQNRFNIYTTPHRIQLAV